MNPTEEKLLATVKAYGDELGKERGIKLDSFVLDDGWDEVQADLWRPSARKFSNGFRKTAEEMRLHVGYADQRVGELVMPAEGKVILTLQPFEVLVFDARFAPKK